MFFQGAEQERLETLLVSRTSYGEDCNSWQELSCDKDNALLGHFKRLLLYAGMSPDKASVVMCKFLLILALGIVVAFLIRSWIPFVVSIALIFFGYRGLVNKGVARAKEFERDYTALLLSLASAIKTGADPIYVLCEAIHLFPKNSVMREELIDFRENIERGVPEDISLNRFAYSINHPDIQLFRGAMVLARKEGSSLSECLQRLARVTRQRQSFVRKIRSAVAMQKLAALGIAGCTVIIGLIQFFANPEGVKYAISHPVGSKIIAFGVCLILTGLWWMRQIAGKRMT
ncbi:MAG: hypothetical protein D6808_00595 [Candidatus Dadabacteria bacterium]|nr:MAG: hypothetical protein D6808_00595 [Candidatus Dadabacteria bacterium]